MSSRPQSIETTGIRGPTQQVGYPGRLLTPDEVAELLHISRRHVTRLAAAGVLIPIRLGARTTRYAPDAVRELINSEMREAAGQGGSATTRKAVRADAGRA